MSHVNVDSDWFFTKQLIDETFADLKSFPDDFQVDEVFEIQQYQKTVEAPFSVPCNDASKLVPKTSNILIQNEDMSLDDAINIIGKSRWDAVGKLNTIDKTKSLKEELKLQLILESSRRGALRIRILDTFPFVSVRHESIQPNGVTDTHDSDIFTLVVSTDHDLATALIAAGMCIVDVTTLIKFKNWGPGHKSSFAGVKVGQNLSRDARGQCFKQLRTFCRCLDSKTVDCNSGVGKAMLIHWSPKALRSATKRRNDYLNKRQNQNTNSSKANSTVEIHLGFILCKRDMEQMHAVQRIADLLGVSPSQISIAGTKDKRAVTFQQCCITLYSPRRTSHQDPVNTDLSDSAQVSAPFRFVRPKANADLAARKIVVAGPTIQIPDSFELCDSQTFLEQIQDHKLRAISRRALLSLYQLSPVSNRPNNSTPSANNNNRSLTVDWFHMRNDKLSPGMLEGNRFNIILRNLRRSSQSIGDVLEIVNARSILDQLQSNMNSLQLFGFPNFFGSQRMGHVRRTLQALTTDTINKNNTELPIGPRIGRHLLRCEYDEALKNIVLDSMRSAEPIEGAAEECVAKLKIARILFESTYSKVSHGLDTKAIFQQVLNALPHSATRARSVVKAMIRLDFQFNLVQGHSMRSVVTSDQEQLVVNSSVNTDLDNVFDRYHSQSEDQDQLDCLEVEEQNLDTQLEENILFENESVVAELRDEELSTRNKSPSTDFHQGLCERVLQHVPHTARNLWICAYQSWLWNIACCNRLKSLGQLAVEGDLIQDQFSGPCGTLVVGDTDNSAKRQRVESVGRANCSSAPSEFRSTKNEGVDLGTFPSVRMLTAADLDRLSEADRRRLLLRVVLPLFSCSRKMQYPGNESGRYYLSLLREEGLPDGSRDVKSVGQLNCMPRGSYRHVLQTPSDVIVEGVCSANTESEVSPIKLAFTLPSGCYATALLREVCRNNSLI